MKKMLCAVLALAFVLTGCSHSGVPLSAPPVYQTYKDIPGVTQAEIDAIDALLKEKPVLQYAALLSTEVFFEQDGSLGGFVPMLYERMSALFGFSFQPQVLEWDAILAKLDTNEIDFVSDFTPTPERMENYFMTEPFIQRSIMLFTNKNDVLANIAKTRPVRCGFVKGTTIHELVADSWQLPYEPVFIDSESEVVEHFVSGKIDAYIDESVLEVIFASCDFIESTEFYPLRYSPVSLATSNPALEPVIDVMQKYLKNGGLEEIAELYSEGTRGYLRHQLQGFLTEEEKAYINAHNTESTAIAVACEAGNYPSSFYNTKEKEFQGIAPDVLSQISDLTGLQFKPGNPPDETWSELLDGVESGKYAVVTDLMQVESRKDRFLWAEEAFQTDYYALLSRADFPAVDINQIRFHSIGLLTNSAFADIFLTWLPDTPHIQMYETTDSAFSALEKGEIDLLMMTQNSLLHVTNFMEKPNFKVNVVFDYATGSYFGFNKDEELLCSIVSKAQHHVDTEAIAEGWKRKVFDYNSKLLKDLLPYAIAVAVLLSAALIAAYYQARKNKRISKSLKSIVAERTNELALQSSTLQTMFDSIPDLVFCKDLELKYTRYNRRFREQFNCIEEDVIGKNEMQALGMPEDTMLQFQETDLLVIRECRSIAAEETILATDGTYTLFETIKTPLMKGGKAVGIMGISRDITARKAAEETLQLTLDNLNTCIYITEIETDKILFINEKMKQTFGGGEFLGKVCWQVLQDGFTERCSFCPIPKLQESGDEYCVWEEHNTATNRHFENTDSLIKWHDGKLVHMQHSVDITDSVNLQKDLAHASRAKGDFLSRMSHEIRTPLNAIIGMNNIALSSNDLEKTHQCHEKIESASKHLLGVINDILDMSKIEADKFELSGSEFDFEKMLMNVINVTHFRAEEKKQELVVNLDKNVPLRIWGDEQRLAQVITNLLSNAIKFTPERGAVLLNAEKIAEQGDEITLQIAVVDNGIGISEEQQARLFTSFEQADGSISRKFGGTGLGLAISKRIVELMGGKIWIESVLDEGSKFIFTCNVKKCALQEANAVSSGITKENINILAVDDSEETLTCFEQIMEAHHLPCDVALSGFEALDKMRQSTDKPYNVFFVDWQMPEMDGIELTRKIKEIAGDNAVVFMISVADWNLIEKEALSAGVKRFVPKPLFPSALINVINECFGARYAKAQAQTRIQNEKSVYDFSGYTILIAEDIEINQEIMVAVLEETGIAIDFADNGAMAVAAFCENQDKYNLILMDIQMPEMDGFEATRLIRAEKSARAKEIPIVAMTANVFREDVENCLAAGMNGHVGKPVDSDELFAMLAKYLP